MSIQLLDATQAQVFGLGLFILLQYNVASIVPIIGSAVHTLESLFLLLLFELSTLSMLTEPVA